MRRFRVGDKVKAHRAKPDGGTWHLYKGKVGTVTSFHDGEYGVALDGLVDVARHQRIAYFTEDELVRAR